MKAGVVTVELLRGVGKTLQAHSAVRFGLFPSGAAKTLRDHPVESPPLFRGETVKVLGDEVGMVFQ